MPVETAAVVTGIGIVNPLGLSVDAFWSALLSQQSGVGHIAAFDASACPVQIAAEVRDFDPKQFVRPRKSLKVMARETQFGVAVADMARENGGLAPEAVDPDRIGAVYGADMIRGDLYEIAEAYRASCNNGSYDIGLWGPQGMQQLFPLGMLKLLPNMMASHVSILQDARGPNNTICQGDASSLLAVCEATSVIERGHADVMIAGGSSSYINPYDWVRNCLYDKLSLRNGDPAAASRPFDAARDGQVRGEGAAALLLESADHARRRGTRVWARVLGYGSGYSPEEARSAGLGIRRAIEAALRHAGLKAQDITHVVARGLSTRADDEHEAAVIHELLGDVPVTAPKSYFGNLAAAGGVTSAVVGALAVYHDEVPATLNYERPDPGCPVNVVRDDALRGAGTVSLVLETSQVGQAAAVILAAPE